MSRRWKILLDWTAILRDLFKLPLSSLNALSAAAGFFLSGAPICIEILEVTIGVFLMASGASALNQYQERSLDALMGRTKSRPIPSGRLHNKGALILSISVLSAGGFLFLLKTLWIAFSLSVLAVFFYNGVYTYLKRKTSLALLPGALIGAIPPAIGWLSGGRSLLDPSLLALVFFFFIWQIPHCWLFHLHCGEDMKRAGFPSLLDLFPRDRMVRITFLWIAGTAICGLFMPLYGIGRSPLLIGFLFTAAIWLIGSSFSLLRKNLPTKIFQTAFQRINVYALGVTLFLIMDHLLLE